MNLTRLIAAGGAACLAVAVVHADALAQRGRGRTGAASLPQVQCAAGVPEATTFASAAQDAINRTLVARENAKAPLFTQAAEQARQGVAAGETNPYHHFLLGQAQLGLGQHASADSALRRTLELCPEFAAEVREVRLNAFRPLFQAGMDAFQANDTATALARWQEAGAVFNEFPDPYFNAGALLSGRGDDAGAIAQYREALLAADRATAAGADSAVVAEVVDTRARTLLGLSNLGVRAFQRDSFATANDVLASVLRANPNDRNAQYVQALALYKLERWSDLIPVANRVLELDPLNYNTYLLLFNAQKGLAEQAAAQNNAAAERQQRDQMVRTLGRADSLPVQVENVRESDGKLLGDIAAGAAAAGSSHVLEFTLFGPAGELGKQRVTVTAPAKDAKTQFEVAIPVVNGEPALLLGYRYQLVQ